VTDAEKYDGLITKYENDMLAHAASYGRLLMLLRQLRAEAVVPPIRSYCMKGEVRVEWYKDEDAFILTWANGGDKPDQWYYYTNKAGTVVASVNECLNALHGFLRG
jgi:hypothetical protein